MPEIGTSGSLSGDGKRSVGHRPQATALILDSTRSKIRKLRVSGQTSDVPKEKRTYKKRQPEEEPIQA